MSIISKVKESAKLAKIRVSKYSPTICLVLGIAGVVGGTVLACNATLKVADKIDDRDRRLLELKEKYKPEAIEATMGEEVTLEAPVAETKEYKHELMKIHAVTYLNIVKDFAPAIICTGGGIALLLNGHNILNKRYIAMTTAYAGLQKSFNDYRENVRQRFGDEIDKELLYGATDVTFTDVNSGEEKTIKCVDVSKYGELSSQTRILFDEKSYRWTKDADNNRIFIELTIHNMNAKLEQRGKDLGKGAVMFLNEVLDALYLPRTQAGNILGWTYDPNVINKIDAGIYTQAYNCDTGAVNFLSGDEPSIWLNFNVDGNVLELV